MIEPRPVALIEGKEATDAMCRSLATYLLSDLGPRPIAVDALTALLSRHGLSVRHVPSVEPHFGLILPWENAVLISADLTEEETRWNLSHLLFHILVGNALEQGFACSNSLETAPCCRRADHGAKFLLVGDAWFGGLTRVEEAAAHFGVPAYQLIEAIRDRI